MQNLLAFIKPPYIHGSLYRDPEIFQRELDLIWHKVWIFVGHESEVANDGDFVRRQIGTQPVIMVRSSGGQINVFHNRCRHRGNLLCNLEKGTADVFQCPYHGWTYSDSGELLEPTFEEGYESALRKQDFGLAPVARVGNYRGLVFASVSTEGISLDEHLGQAKEYLDLILDLSPTGRILLNAGTQKLSYAGNWKFLPENSLEGDYHGPFIHKIAFELHSKKTGLDLSSLYQDEVPDVIRSLPGGHMVEDYRKATMSPPKRAPSPAREAYIRAMNERYGPARAAELLSTTPPLVFVFPNLIYIMTHFRRVQPVSVDRTHVYYQPMFLEEVAPEINEARLREHEFGFGPSSFISPDDIEIMERNQIGLQAKGNDWLFIGRGAHRERVLPDGGTRGFTMDENHLRGMWRHYANLMA
jgi:phenylpropionate dioxygenase-like ring-hydroxylating dioxygenase large terminal subunit